MRLLRGYSSAGRALEWHSRGQRFDPAYLHQKAAKLSNKSLFSSENRDFSFARESVQAIHTVTYPQICSRMNHAPKQVRQKRPNPVHRKTVRDGN